MKTFDAVLRDFVAPETSKQSRREAELQHLRSLPDAPWDGGRPTGVLLADEIKYYANTFSLIQPFEPIRADTGEKKLRAAGYDLSIGEIYSKG